MDGLGEHLAGKVWTKGVDLRYDLYFAPFKLTPLSCVTFWWKFCGYSAAAFKIFRYLNECYPDDTFLCIRELRAAVI